MIPAELAPYWRGTEPPNGVPIPPGWRWGDPGGPACDYDRACAIDDCVGMVDAGPGAALVLGGEPMRTTFFPADDGGVFARWGYADREEDVLRAVQTAPETIWTTLPVRFGVGLVGVLIIDSASTGKARPPRREGTDRLWLELSLAGGFYGVEFADYKPNDKTWSILVRLALVSP